MESYHISDDRTVSVIKLQDGQKVVNVKVNGSLEKSVNFTPSRWAELFLHLCSFYRMCGPM